MKSVVLTLFCSGFVRLAVMRLILIITATLLALYAAFTLLLYILQARLIYIPMRQMEASPEDIGLPYESVELKTPDGVILSSWYVPAGDSRGVLLFCHGNAGNISHRLHSIEIFNKLGLDVFIFDYRGYGESTGKPSEKGTYLDARAAWDYLVNTRKISPDSIIIFGRSLGASIAAKTAMDVSPAGLVVESGFSSLETMGRELYPVMPVRLILRYNYNTVGYVKNVKSPVFIIHSKDDEIVPYSHGVAIFKAAGEPKEFLDISGDHNQGFLLSGEIYMNGLSGFAERVLPMQSNGH